MRLEEEGDLELKQNVAYGPVRSEIVDKHNV